ncbi:MAG: SCP2 sterol-binding domain-containing protein [Thermoanaerobaculia bacterium]
MSELEVFESAWTERLAEELNSDERYRRAAGDWKGVLGLALAIPGRETRTAILDLESGHCHRTSTDPSACPPDYVIEADAGTWKSVLAGDLEPMWGLMSGKLRLTTGHLTELVPHAPSALRIVKCAQRIASRFPEPRKSEGNQ